MNKGGNFLEKKSLSEVAIALTGISRFKIFISLSVNKINIKIKIEYKISIIFLFYIDI